MQISLLQEQFRYISRCCCVNFYVLFAAYSNLLRRLGPKLIEPNYLMNELAVSLSFPEILEFPEAPLRLNFGVLPKYTIHRLSDIERSRIQ